MAIRSARGGFFRRVALILAVVLSVLAVYCVLDVGVGLLGIQRNRDFYKTVTAVGSSLQVQEQEDGNFTIVTDGELRILQLSDIHIGGGAISANEDTQALQAVVDMVRAVKPDLVTITGDIVYPVWIQTGSVDNLGAMQMLANTMEALEVYWCPVFGNHDSEGASTATRAELGAYLSSLTYCLFSAGPADIDGVGNYRVRVENTQGVITQSLYFLDSGEYMDAKNPVLQTEQGRAFVDTYGRPKYDHVHPSQIAYYEQLVAEDLAANAAVGAAVPASLLFIHIPTVDFEDAANTQAPLSGSNGESVSYGYDYGLFERVVALGSTRGIFVGHDHVNTSDYLYRGVHLCYTKSIDYTAYIYIKLTNAHRGGRLIVLDGAGGFTTEILSITDIR